MANSKILTAEQEKHCVSRLRNMSEKYKKRLMNSEKMVRQKSLCTRAGSKT